MKNEPLGLPKGSVRAIIALSLVGAAIFVSVTGIDSDLLAGLSGMSVAFYFKKRDEEQEPTG